VQASEIRTKNGDERCNLKKETSIIIMNVSIKKDSPVEKKLWLCYINYSSRRKKYFFNEKLKKG